MLSIFISYSRESKEVVRVLAQDFEELGHKVWFDDKLTGGQDWWSQILEKIRECDLFAFALSPQALDSYACKLEWTYSFSLDKTILPILVADSVSMNLVPPELSAIQYADYRDQSKKAAFALNKALAQLPAPKPLPHSLPEAPEIPVSYLGNLKDQIDAPKNLSFEEQSALVLQLKGRLTNQDEINDVHELLQRLRKRDDLLANIAADIDSLLIGKERNSSEPKRRPAEPTKSTLRENNALPEKIRVEDATEDVAEILREVLDSQRVWILQSYSCRFELSAKEGGIMVKAEWEEWTNLWSMVKMEMLKKLNWKVDKMQMILVGGVMMIAIVSYGVVLFIPSLRTILKKRKAIRTWRTIEGKGQLSNVAIDIVQAIKSLDSNSKTITADKGENQLKY